MMPCWLVSCRLVLGGVVSGWLVPPRPTALVRWATALLGQHLEVIALVLEAGVVPTKNHLQETLAAPARILRQLRHSLGEVLVRACKVRHDRGSIAGSAGDVVLRVVGVDNREAVVVLVSKLGHLVLCWRTQSRLACSCGGQGSKIEGLLTFGIQRGGFMLIAIV